MAFLVPSRVAKVCLIFNNVTFKTYTSKYLTIKKECDCNATGTESCNKGNGQCICIANVDGKKCDACKDGYYGYLPNCLPCPKGWIGPTIKEKCYNMSSSSMAYFEAKEKCESMLSKLAEPLDSTEGLIISEAAPTSVVWIGINDIQQENE